ncbi:MAG TPA: short-chain dehydrogenase [Clostridiales bacterium]|nr:short-chain dehydrogenase [Clostridiales bacterium]
MRQIADLFDLSGKTAIVTGGYGTYGHTLSEALAEAGALVIIASRDVEKCRQEADKLADRGLKAAALPLDQGDEASIQNLIRTVAERYGHLDILVNNAVLRSAPQDIDNMTVSEWQKQQLVNSTGLAVICREAVQVMRKQKSGSIINISSIQGSVGPHFPVYGSTGMTSPAYYTYEKWGMVGLTKWMANRYGPDNIRVNCISPGGYNPSLTRDEANEFVQNYKKLTPMGRFAEEDDLKGPIVFLASDASKYVTGHNLLVDGGWTSW